MVRESGRTVLVQFSGEEKSRTADRRNGSCHCFRLCLPPSGHSRPRPLGSRTMRVKVLPGGELWWFFPGEAFNRGRVFEYGFALFGGSVGVLRKQDKDSSLVKIVPQLPGCDRLCPVRREVGKPPPALLDGHTLPQQKGRKLVKAASLGKCLPYRPAQLRLVRFKLGGLGRLSGGFSGSVLFIKGKLPFLCRPVFPFGYPFLLPFKRSIW